MSLQLKYSDVILLNSGDSSTSTVQRLLYELESHRAWKHQLPRGLQFSGWDFRVLLLVLLRYSDVFLFSLGDSDPPSLKLHVYIFISMEKVIRLGNIEGP